MFRHPHQIALAAFVLSTGAAFATAADEIRTVWTELADGKPVFVAKSHLVRKPR